MTTEHRRGSGVRLFEGERRAEALAMLRAGSSKLAVARAFGCNDRTVHRWLERDPEARTAFDTQPPRFTHGASGYNRGCRCVTCTVKHRTHMQRLRERRRATRPIPAHVPHGTASTYGNWSCRCDPCTAANREKCRQYSEAHR